jgi:uridylate kinase
MSLAKSKTRAKSKRGPFKRVLLKLSGETLAKAGAFGIDRKVLEELARNIAAVANRKTEVAVVVGGGNIWRARDHADLPIERSASDQMGMLAGVMNAIALQSSIEQIGTPCRVQSAINIPQVAEPYIRRRAIRHLEKGRVVILAAGTGQPYFTHDTAAAVRALEVGADVLLKGSNVDGVYSADPAKDKRAKRYEHVTYTDVLARELGVMDSAAISLCRENDLPIIVFNALTNGSLSKVIAGQPIGTLVTR